MRLLTKLVTVATLSTLSLPLSAQVLTYKYDNGNFDSGLGTSGYAIQLAQKFELQQHGRIRWLEACFWRRTTDPNHVHSFSFDIHSSRGDKPGASRIGRNRPSVTQNLARTNTVYCGRTNYSHAVPAGDTWISVRFFGSEGVAQSGSVGDGKLLAQDDSKVRFDGVKSRNIALQGGSAVAGEWGEAGFLGFGSHFPVGIRIGVEHGGPPTPPPEPPTPTGQCTPTTDVLHFDGDYRVRMCYVTGEGETGQARAGVWSSSQSGILWFFSRENAEVLVKVLDGCGHNGYRWVFVAPVTTLGFELRITAPDGKTWTHTNQVNQTASTKSDTSAFRCN